jgi:hypothetical protein
LKGVLRDLAPLEKQGKVEGFFNNNENAALLSGLVEGVRDAMMEYQVCSLNSSSPPRLIPFQASLLQGIYAEQRDMGKKVGVIMVNLIPLPSTPAV